jgi:hypothetical protein
MHCSRDVEDGNVAILGRGCDDGLGHDIGIV